MQKDCCPQGRQLTQHLQGIHQIKWPQQFLISSWRSETVVSLLQAALSSSLSLHSRNCNLFYPLGYLVHSFAVRFHPHPTPIKRLALRDSAEHRGVEGWGWGWEPHLIADHPAKHTPWARSIENQCPSTTGRALDQLATAYSIREGASDDPPSRPWYVPQAHTCVCMCSRCALANES